MIRRIRTLEELQGVVDHGNGFIYNDFGGRDPKMCPIHSVSCRWVATMLEVDPGALSVQKLWSSNLQELLAELVVFV